MLPSQHILQLKMLEGVTVHLAAKWQNFQSFLNEEFLSLFFVASLQKKKKSLIYLSLLAPGGVRHWYSEYWITD